MLAKAGRASFMLGPAAQQVGPRDVLVLDRVCGGRLAAREGGEFYFGNFVLNPEQLFPLLDGAEISFLQKVTEVFKGARVYPAQSESARECHRLAEGVTAQYDLGHRSQLLRVGAVILSAEFKQARRHASGYVRIEEHMMQVFEQLSTGEILNSSVSELAEKFGCSPPPSEPVVPSAFWDIGCGLEDGDAASESRVAAAKSRCQGHSRGGGVWFQPFRFVQHLLQAPVRDQPGPVAQAQRAGGRPA